MNLKRFGESITFEYSNSEGTFIREGQLLNKLSGSWVMPAPTFPSQRLLRHIEEMFCRKLQFASRSEGIVVIPHTFVSAKIDCMVFKPVNEEKSEEGTQIP